jgi:hypothetical protein
MEQQICRNDGVGKYNSEDKLQRQLYFVRLHNRSLSQRKVDSKDWKMLENVSPDILHSHDDSQM